MYFQETKHQHAQESCVFPTAPTACLYSLSTIDRLAATFQLADMAGDIQGSSDQTAKPKPHTVVQDRGRQTKLFLNLKQTYCTQISYIIFLKLFIRTYSKIYLGI